MAILLAFSSQRAVKRIMICSLAPHLYDVETWVTWTARRRHGCCDREAFRRRTVAKNDAAERAAICRKSPTDSSAPGRGESRIGFRVWGHADARRNDQFRCGPMVWSHAINVVPELKLIAEVDLETHKNANNESWSNVARVGCAGNPCPQRSSPAHGIKDLHIDMVIDVRLTTRPGSIGGSLPGRETSSRHIP